MQEIDTLRWRPESESLNRIQNRPKNLGRVGDWKISSFGKSSYLQAFSHNIWYVLSVPTRTEERWTDFCQKSVMKYPTLHA